MSCFMMKYSMSYSPQDFFGRPLVWFHLVPNTFRTSWLRHPDLCHTKASRHHGAAASFDGQRLGSFGVSLKAIRKGGVFEMESLSVDILLVIILLFLVEQLMHL